MMTHQLHVIPPKKRDYRNRDCNTQYLNRKRD